MGIRSPIKRSTMADASERRDWRIQAEFAQRLIAQARKLCVEEDLELMVPFIPSNSRSLISFGS